MKDASKFKHLLIVTHGRTGSTLLQGLLNSIPGYLIRGENNDMCFHLFRARTELELAKMKHGGPQTEHPTSPWYGIDRVGGELFFNDARTLVRNQLLSGHDANVRCLGFKEIRYFNNEHLSDYLDFLRTMLPEAGVIFLTRSLDEVCKSKWWADMPETDVRTILSEFRDRMKHYYESHQRTTFCIDYGDITARSGKLISMYDFLGEEYDERTVNNVLSVMHSCATIKPGQ